MKISQIVFISSVILNIFLLAVVFDDEKIDSTTHATPHTEIDLPPDNPEYSVLGIIPGIKKFAVKYNEKLIRGGLPYSEKGYDFLTKENVKTVISIVPDNALKQWGKKNNVKVIDLPFEKSTGLSSEQRQELIDIYKTEAAPFYVHCHGGTHRASACAALYRINLEKWTTEKAIKEYDLLGGDPDKEKALIDSIK